VVGQLRGIKLEDVPEIFKRLDAFGITTTQSGMDNVRNIVGSPIAGIDKDEIVDTREYCYLMNDYIADMGKGHKEITHLPRKFNVSIVVRTLHHPPAGSGGRAASPHPARTDSPTTITSRSRFRWLPSNRSLKSPALVWGAGIA